MKKVVLLGLLVLAMLLLSSCVPTEPQDVLPYCQEQYENLLVDDPDFPPAFIGACVSYFQTGEPNAFVSLCGYEPFWETINEGEGLDISSRKECMQFIQNLPAP